MSWPADVPDFLMKKPHALEKLEKLPLNTLNAMTKTEIDETIRDAANSLAKAYYSIKKSTGSFDESFQLVSGALEQTGSSIGGRLGNVMIGTSKKASEIACREYYPENLFPNEEEF